MTAFPPSGIYLADAYQAIKAIPDKSVDLIYTDIPYEISVDHGAGAFGIKKKIHFGQFVSISRGIDYSIFDDFCRVLKQINLYIWCSKNQIYSIMQYFIGEKNCRFEILTWHKTNPLPTVNNKYLSDTEYCLFFRDGAKLGGKFETKSKYHISPTNIADKKLFEHSTIKPLPFVRNHIMNSTSEGDVVLDPFCGSGTTLVACKDLNRRYIGFEINPQYHKIAVDRLNGIDAHGQTSLFIR